MGYKYDVRATKPAGGLLKGLLDRNSPEQMLKRDIENEATQDRFEGYLAGFTYNQKNPSEAKMSVHRITPEGVCAAVEYALGHLEGALGLMDAKLGEKMASENPEDYDIVLELYVGAETGKLVRLRG